VIGRFASSPFQFSKPSVLGVALLVASGCGGALYKVKPVVELPPLSSASKSASAGGISVRVAPLLTDEESQEFFEANLPLSGVLPVRVALEYESGVPVEIGKARFRLRDGEGHEWKQLSPKQAVSRILKANGVFAYNPNSRKQFEQELTSYGIDLKTPLTGSDRQRHGFLFFEAPGKEPVPSEKTLTLHVEKVPQPVQLALN
jgi:hypothetical protein